MKKTVLILALVVLSHCAIGQIILKNSDNPLYVNVLSISEKDSVIVDSLLSTIPGCHPSKFIVKDHVIYEFYSGFGSKKNRTGFSYTLAKYSVNDNKMNLVSSSNIWTPDYKTVFDPNTNKEISLTENGLLFTLPKTCLDGFVIPFECFADPKCLNSFLKFLEKQASKSN